MGAVTYPEPFVAETIMDRFVPVHVNALEEWGHPIVERYRQVWTPDIRVLGTDGYDYYHWNGYLPPAEFVPQLLVGQGQAYLRLHDEPRAADVYADVLRRFPTSAVAPEAAYFYAIARYKTTHEAVDLRGSNGWKRLQTRYPNSIWRLKQSFNEDA